MQDFDSQNKKHVLPIIIRYLVNNELYKTAKKLTIESKLKKPEHLPIHEKKLESIIQFYAEYWGELGEPGKSKGSLRKASTEIHNLTEPVETAKTESPKLTKANPKKAKKVKVVKPKTKKKIVKRVIKKVKKPKQATKKEAQTSQKPKTKSDIPDQKQQTEQVLGKRAQPGPEPEKPKRGRRITKKQKQEKLEERRKQKQTTYQNFKEASEADAQVDKHFSVVVNRGNTFTRCANVKRVKIDLYNSKWSKKVRRGGEDEFGSLGFERLAHTRGKDFKKEKAKLKNREFQGCKITFRNNLIDLD